MAAEKMAEAGTINKCDKNAVVVDLLEKNGITVNETVRALIEAAVKELDLLEDKVVEWVVENEPVDPPDDAPAELHETE